MSTNNKAVVCRIKTKPHPNADRVQLGDVMGYQVVVGKDVEDGELGVYFPENVCLSEDFAKANPGLMEYFPKNRRVRAQKFRGEVSDGFWIRIDTLNATVNKYEEYAEPLTRISEGEAFNTLCGVLICYKYINPHSQSRQGGLQAIKGQKKGSLPTFQKHHDTEQLRLHWDKIKSSDRVVITSKLHGTSQRVGNCLVNKKLSWLEKVGKKIGFDINEQEYKFLIGTRNVILKENHPDGHHTTSFREDAASVFKDKLHKNEVVYYEVVGWENYNTPIMGRVGIKKEDKDLRKLYGESVIYSYGCKQGEHDVYVYRIAHQNEDGDSVDLSWEQVKERCNELGVKYVPEVDTLVIGDVDFVRDNQIRYIENLIKDRPDLIDPSHPYEGVVLRIEGIKPKSYKHKTFVFKYLEGIIKERKDFVDLEDVS